MSVNGRNKGAAFERFIASEIHRTTGFVVQRNLEQYRAREQGDLLGVPGWTIECKHYRTGAMFKPEWWHQVEAAALASGNNPALVFRFNRQPIWVAIDSGCRSLGYTPTLASFKSPIVLAFEDWLSLLA